jgi:hypothetical protein
VIKPSELTPAVSSTLAELFPKYMDNELYHVVNGAVPETTKVSPLDTSIRFSLSQCNSPASRVEVGSQYVIVSVNCTLTSHTILS